MSFMSIDQAKEQTMRETARFMQDFSDFQRLKNTFPPDLQKSFEFDFQQKAIKLARELEDVVDAIESAEDDVLGDDDDDDGCALTNQTSLSLKGGTKFAPPLPGPNFELLRK
jgi:hypothetical protein